MRAINFGFWDAEDPAAIVNINAVSNQLSCVAHRIKCNNIEDENWDHGDHRDYHSAIVPTYSCHYVSWSKNPNIPTDYMLLKLNGPITKISAVIAGNYYGIDLQALGHSRHEEYEVVSPMLSEIVIQTEVLYDND